MADLYSRLDEAGFPSSYVRGYVLPEWWDDALALELENRRIAEMAISRTLKIPLSSLANGSEPLKVSDERTVRFKRWKDVDGQQLVPTVAVARRVCELTIAAADLPALRIMNATELREQILRTQEYVSLTPLVQHCWSLGIPVVHLKEIPVGARRLAGLALMASGRPCIALADSRKSPAWHAWPLAHEMGHIAHGHCQLEDTVDLEMDLAAEDPAEMQANDYAKALLYGSSGHNFRSEQIISAPRLAQEAKELGKEFRIHPACVVTNYGFNMKAYEEANAALKILRLATGGAEPVRIALAERLDLSRLTETDRHFLQSVTGLAER
jgi:Zn-dependent peptidase ImmA (M78 family)